MMAVSLGLASLGGTSSGGGNSLQAQPSPAASPNDVDEFQWMYEPDGDAGARRPNIILWVTDDQGWANIGYHSKYVHTPTMDELAYGGIRLDRHYAYHWCTPSRASLMTGRLPHHAIERSNQRIPESWQFLPALMEKAGYATAHVGKWHLGNLYTWQTPEKRGFRQSYGYLGAALDYWAMTNSADAWPCDGIDWWVNGAPKTKGIPGGRSSLDHQTHQIKSVIETHNASTKLFLYVAAQAMHSPVPTTFFNTTVYGNFSQEYAIANGLITHADGMLKEALLSLRKRDMWRDTLLVHTSDNGGTVMASKYLVRGSNFPLRGAKFTSFEGGVRVPTFLAGGFVPEKRKGQKLEGMMHLADWYVTFAKLAGLSLTPTSPAPDGHDMWPYLSGTDSKSPRTTLLLSTSFNYTRADSEWTEVAVGTTDALIVGDLKLILGQPTCDVYTTLDYPTGGNDDDCKYNCRQKGPDASCAAQAALSALQLFDVGKDPTESFNLAPSRPDLVASLRAELYKQKATAITLSYKTYGHTSDPVLGPTLGGAFSPAVVARCKKYVAEHGGHLGPFMDGCPHGWCAEEAR